MVGEKLAHEHFMRSHLFAFFAPLREDKGVLGSITFGSPPPAHAPPSHGVP